MSLKDTHDRKVKSLARILKKGGYSVKASVGAYSKPDKIENKYIPDIVAKNKRTGKIKIIEVKIGKELKKARDKLLTFSKCARKSRKTAFELVITNPRTKK